MNSGIDAAAAFALQLSENSSDGLSGASVDWFPLALLDTLAVMAAGTTTLTSVAAARTAARWPGAPMAAFANATAANAFDFDDGHYAGGGIHPGSTIVPALLAAVNPQTRLRDLFVPLVVGYEIAIRAGAALSPAMSGEPYRASGHAACLGATAALARALGLDIAQTTAALRVADSNAPVSRMRSIAVKESIGWAAATAVTSVALALDGFEPATGAQPPMLLPSTLDLPDAGLAADWTTLRCLEVYTKHFACCRAGQAALDAIASTGVDAAQIISIRVGVPAGFEGLTQRDPRSLEEAQFSIPIAVAALLTHGDVSPFTLNDTTVAELASSPIAAKVTVEHDPALDSHRGDGYAATVRIETPGRVSTATRLAAAGGTAEPLSSQRRLAKASSCLLLVLEPAEAREYISGVLDGSLTVAQALAGAHAVSAPPLAT